MVYRGPYSLRGCGFLETRGLPKLSITPKNDKGAGPYYPAPFSASSHSGYWWLRGSELHGRSGGYGPPEMLLLYPAKLV